MNNKRGNLVEVYSDFLKYCLQEDAHIPDNLNDIDWDELYEFGKKQAILGIFFYGIKKLPIQFVVLINLKFLSGIVRVCL